MMDLIPKLVDGAVICSLVNGCQFKTRTCQECDLLVIKIYNWLKHTSLEYIVLDFQDEKEICPIFLQEIMQLKKRLRIHLLFSGVRQQPRKLLEGFNYGDVFPIFLSPEDAIRALRMQNPGLTEAPLKTSIVYGNSLARTMDAIHQTL